jgi:hypothetical protein
MKPSSISSEFSVACLGPSQGISEVILRLEQSVTRSFWRGNRTSGLNAVYCRVWHGEAGITMIHGLSKRLPGLREVGNISQLLLLAQP